jgi:hypothetical protein
MVDDFYLNLLSWSCQNAVAVALKSYIWKADTGTVIQLGECPEGSYISSPPTVPSWELGMVMVTLSCGMSKLVRNSGVRTMMAGHQLPTLYLKKFLRKL